MMATNWIVEMMSVIFLMPAQEFGGTVMMTISLKLVIYPKWLYYRESQKNKNKTKSDVRLNIFIICFFNIRTIDLTKHSSIYFQEFATISKINNMKRVIEDLNVFRKYFRVRQEVSDEIQTSISFINYELQTSIENNIYRKIKYKNHFG